MSTRDTAQEEKQAGNSESEVEDAQTEARTDAIVPGSRVPFEDALKASMAKFDTALNRLAK